MRKQPYDRVDGDLIKKEAKIYGLVNEISELKNLQERSDWRKLKVDQGDKYALYFLVNGKGKNTEYYKVVKFRRGREPKVVRYYKRVVR